MNCIKVHGIRTFSFHGCLEEEKIIISDELDELEQMMMENQMMEEISESMYQP